MAIDTVAKRYSVAIVNLPIFPRVVIPDGAIGQADRQTIDLCYGGILAGSAVAPVRIGKREMQLRFLYKTPVARKGLTFR